MNMISDIISHQKKNLIFQVKEYIQVFNTGRGFVPGSEYY